MGYARIFLGGRSLVPYARLEVFRTVNARKPIHYLGPVRVG
jgi:hypothetical protein